MGVIDVMSDEAAYREVVIANRQGLHARPAHAFVTLANQFEAKIEIERNGERVDGKSILSILTLGAVQGTRLTLHVTGEDASSVLEALVQLVENGFAEEDLESDEEQGVESQSANRSSRSGGSPPGP